jgi:hypothetical protein
MDYGKSFFAYQGISFRGANYLKNKIIFRDQIVAKYKILKKNVKLDNCDQIFFTNLTSSLSKWIFILVSKIKNLYFV